MKTTLSDILKAHHEGNLRLVSAYARNFTELDIVLALKNELGMKLEKAMKIAKGLKQ